MQLISLQHNSKGFGMMLIADRGFSKIWQYATFLTNQRLQSPKDFVRKL